MNTTNQSLFYALLMLVAGLGISVMAALNGGLGSKLQSPALATVILFGVGLFASVFFLFIREGIPSINTEVLIPKYYYLGGVFVIFYILSITWVAPKFGVGNAVSFVLLGQLISMSIIDHFGLLNAPSYEISPARLIGLVFMAIGVLLVVRRS